jgi:alpha-beta hydrolase superfamily lysophospholipase
MSTKVNVSGLEIHVYGLDDVRKSKAHFVDVVFLLHGRMGKYQDVEPFALAILAKDKAVATPDLQRGLIVVSFDQRNHGHRQISELENFAWAEGNQFHALVPPQW